MDRGIRITKLFGIKIKIDWSWLLILLLVVWNLSVMFSQLHPEWSSEFTVFMGITAALLFFLSVLFHELSHSLVAKSQGIPVDSIMLFLFGGVANIREEPKSPKSEFWMAIFGPVTSLIIGFILIGLSGVGLQPGQLQNIEPLALLEGLSPLRTLALWLGSINIILALFNMIPGFPLDGGRVLRSIFWAMMNDLRKATRWAAFVGQGIAWVMIVSGISMIFGIRIPFFGEGIINGVWLILIGWFLNNAASRSYHQVVIRDILEDVPVSQMTRRNPPTVSGNLTINELIENYIMQTDDHAFPVLDHEKLLGIVSLDDVRKVSSSERASMQVEDIMTPREKLLIIGPDEEAHQALMMISRNAIRQLVVMDGDQLIGLVRRRDIVRFLQLQSDDFSSLPKDQGDIINE